MPINYTGWTPNSFSKLSSFKSSTRAISLGSAPFITMHVRSVRHILSDIVERRPSGVLPWRCWSSALRKCSDASLRHRSTRKIPPATSCNTTLLHTIPSVCHTAETVIPTQSTVITASDHWSLTQNLIHVLGSLRHSHIQLLTNS